ncbi:hypothetical protein F5Y16DRAFT_266900 [Xylariaceae sp. FL0255]|nr:hypothetical protein F5Y16DRAFT_266900 [Xylariaceae sp. FL0255]
MKGRPIDQLVYEYMFPKPRSTDVQNFQSLLHRHLILEVRQEVHSFYGHLDTQEAKYPGLDYCHPIHRIRLSRWPWHRRLFRAFDGLRLTNAEIAGLTKWEGTKWAKDRFERDAGVVIRDTAADEVGVWIEPEDRLTRRTADTPRSVSEGFEDESEDEEMDGEEDDEEEESDGEIESIGFALNERLRERAARREAGETEVLEDEWEQWLKNVIDSGQFPFPADSTHDDSTLLRQAMFPPRMISAARASRWHEIPEFLHDILRRTIEIEAGATTVTARQSRLPTPPLSEDRPLRPASVVLARLANMRRTAQPGA